MSTITITLPDGTQKQHPKGVTGTKIAEAIGARLAKDAIAIKVNGVLKDLPLPLEEDAEISILTWKDREGKEVFWHSTAHLVAHAVTDLFGDAKRVTGPAIEEGFYHDFEREEPFTKEDVDKIEKRVQELVDKNFEVPRKEVSKEEALEIFKDNPYKKELVEEFEPPVSVYDELGKLDLCKGPHVPKTGMISAFKLTKVSGAYWKGDAKNTQLQRIYGISFPQKKQLAEYLKQQEEAQKRDHTKLGERLELFTHFDQLGKGLPVFLPRGELVRQEIENFAMECEKKAGYVRVTTPHLAKKELFLQSGHLPYYEEDMYPPMKMDDGQYYLKAMNCPIHHLVYNKKLKSYRDMPFRLAEYGTCYRNELSGTLTGLLRVRVLHMNDAHIYCTKEQIDQEIENVITLIKNYFEVFDLKDYWFRLSLRDPDNKDKYIDEPENWDDTEKCLRNVLKRLKVKFVEEKDEAAFYGPKIDIQFKNVYGREESMSTVQLDFAAKSRFNLTYVDKNGEKNNDVFVIHRAPLSTHERFMAFLIEHFAGKFPLWLAPEQVRILSVSDSFNEYAHQIEDKLKENNIRVSVDERTESIPKKVREAQLLYVPIIVTVGEKEQSAQTVATRTLDGKVKFGMNVEEFVKKVKLSIDSKAVSIVH